MATREQRQTARRLWLAGELTEKEIAKTVGVPAKSLERWRDDENWAELRDVIDARAAVKREGRAEDADERGEILVDVLENLMAKLLQKGAGSVSPDDLKTLGSALESSRKVRRDILLTRRDRELRKGREK